MNVKEWVQKKIGKGTDLEHISNLSEFIVVVIEHNSVCGEVHVSNMKQYASDSKYEIKPSDKLSIVPLLCGGF